MYTDIPIVALALVLPFLSLVGCQDNPASASDHRQPPMDAGTDNVHSGCRYA